MMRSEKSVLSTIAASAGDITVSQGYVSITGIPTMKYNLIRDAGFGYVVPVAEVLGSITVTPSSITAGIPNTLVITQFIGSIGVTVTEVLSYTPVTGDTATIVCNAWRAQLLLFKDLQITGSGTSTCILAANASSATAVVSYATTNKYTYRNAILSVQSTSGTNSVAQTTAAVAITGVTVTTESLILTGTTPATGTVVAISGVVGATNVNGVFIVGTVVSNVSFGVKNYYTGLNIAQGGAWVSGGYWVAGTVPYIASTSFQQQGGQSRGYFWDLIADGIDSSLIVSNKTYNQVIFNYDERSSSGVVSEILNTSTLYVLSDATNYANFATRMVELVNDFVASGTTADPLNAKLI